MAEVTYNGITIATPTISISSGAVYDEGDQAVAYTRSTVSVIGTVSADSAAAMAASINGIRAALLTPRANLFVSLNGNALFDINSPDDMGGPKPRRCEIRDLVGSRFAIVVFDIDVSLADCTDGGAVGNVISNRYSVTATLDQRFFTTRTISGTLIVRETVDANNPDALRNLVTPTIPKGFKRDSMTFIVTPDGRTLKYEIIDKEVYLTAPPPAVRCTGTFGHHVTTGFVYLNQVQVEIEGTKNADKLDLFNAAFAICSERVDLTNIKNEILQDATIQEELFEPIVRMSFVTLSANPSSPTATYPASSALFKAVSGTEDNTSADIGPYGSALIGAATQAFYYKCIGAFDPATGTDASGESSGPDITAGEMPDNTQLENSGSDNQSASQLANPYIRWQESRNYSQENGVVGLPSSRPLEDGKAYQLHNPIVTIIQVGSATRMGAPVQVPPPRHEPIGYSFCNRRNVQTFAPNLAPNKKTFIYTANWRYELVVPLTASIDMATVYNPLADPPAPQYIDSAKDKTGQDTVDFLTIPNGATNNTNIKTTVVPSYNLVAGGVTA